MTSALDQAVEELWNAGVVDRHHLRQPRPEHGLLRARQRPVRDHRRRLDSNDTLRHERRRPSRLLVATASPATASSSRRSSPPAATSSRACPTGSMLDYQAPGREPRRARLPHGERHLLRRPAGRRRRRAPAPAQPAPDAEPGQVAPGRHAAARSPAATPRASTSPPRSPTPASLQSANQGIAPSTGLATGAANGLQLDSAAAKDAVGFQRAAAQVRGRPAWDPGRATRGTAPGDSWKAREAADRSRRCLRPRGQPTTPRPAIFDKAAQGAGPHRPTQLAAAPSRRRVAARRARVLRAGLDGRAATYDKAAVAMEKAARRGPPASPASRRSTPGTRPRSPGISPGSPRTRRGRPVDGLLVERELQLERELLVERELALEREQLLERQLLLEREQLLERELLLEQRRLLRELLLWNASSSWNASSLERALLLEREQLAGTPAPPGTPPAHGGWNSTGLELGGLKRPMDMDKAPPRSPRLQARRDPNVLISLVASAATAIIALTAVPTRGTRSRRDPWTFLVFCGLALVLQLVQVEVYNRGATSFASAGRARDRLHLHHRDGDAGRRRARLRRPRRPPRAPEPRRLRRRPAQPRRGSRRLRVPRSRGRATGPRPPSSLPAFGAGAAYMVVNSGLLCLAMSLADSRTSSRSGRSASAG